MNAKQVKNVSVAFKAHMGWVNAVVVCCGTATPEPVRVQRIELSDPDDREASEPYHVAGGWNGLTQSTPPDNPAEIVERGRARQVKRAGTEFAAFRETLAGDGADWQQAVLLTSRGIVHTLEDALAYHSHIHVAEGEAIRDATRAAIEQLGINLALQDEKNTLSDSGGCLGWPGTECDEWMKARKPGKCKWAKEERLIAWAAWYHARLL